MKQKKWISKRKIFLMVTLVFAVCLMMTTSAWAARKIEITSANANNFIEQLNRNGVSMAPVFGLSQEEQFKLLRKKADFNGVIHFRYEQTYKGIPVWGMQTIVSIGRGNNVTRLHGSIVIGSPDDIGGVPDISALNPLGALNQTQEAHKNKDPGARWSFRNEKYGTYIYLDKNDRAHLCYIVSFFADTDCGNPSHPIFFIDAKSGSILDSYNMLRFQGTGPGGNIKTGKYFYGTNYPAFCVTESGGTCTMNCANVKTVDLNHGTSGTTPFSFTCYENTHEEINGAYSPLNDAQYFGQVVFDTYQNWYGVPVLPFQLTLKCHYSNNYENAFWDGSSMTFGDGYSTFYPLVSLDVVAHEVSHGFTQYNSDLIYSGQSGGINEAFSDMAGEACKYYMKSTNDYKVGYDIYKAANGALRYMYNPPLDGRSIDNVANYYDGLDVHYSSGIFNKVFYLIATTSGWNTHKAFDIFVKANQDYWIPSSTFIQGAEGAMDAAVDYGYSCQDVVNAFAVVGINLVCPGPPVANFSATPVSGGIPFSTMFTDLSQAAASWSWNFGDGGTSTLKNPTHTYTTVGVYTVTLTSTNEFGSDTEVKTDYITVLPPQPPIADFVASAADIDIGGSVTFTDKSLENPTSWSWTFAGGTPATSTVKNPTITFNTVGTYTVTLVATNAQGSDTETKVGYITVSVKPYCDTWGDIQEYEYIAGVSVADLNNPSGATSYSDFTNLTAHIKRGDSFNVVLTPGFPGSSYSENWKIWIDYNDDHDFEEAGEEVFSGSGSSNVTGSFTVPTTAKIGATRMRVTMSYYSTPQMCDFFPYGEVEDYTVNIGGTFPTLTVTSPNGGESWQLGSIRNITWDAGNLSANLKITLWKDNALVGTIAENVVTAAGSYAWTVGKYTGGTALAGTGYTIKIKEIGTNVSDVSNAPFSISYLAVTSPNGGENLQFGSIQNITWDSIGVIANLKITLWKNGVSVGVIAENAVTAAGSYSWAVGKYIGGMASGGTGYTIKIKEIGAVVSDTSNSTFSLNGLIVNSPNGGESWKLGSIHAITWSAGGLSNNMKITLWKDGVSVGTIANSVAPSAGSFSWTVGNYIGGTAVAGAGYSIKIKEIGTVVSDISDVSFSLTN